MKDIAPFVFLNVCKHISETTEGTRQEVPVINLPGVGADTIIRWLAGVIKEMKLPDVRVFTPEEGVHPDLVVRFRSDAGDSSYLGIEVRQLDADEDGKDKAGAALDFSSLPPSGIFKVERPDGKHLFVKGYYLFLLLDHRAGETAHQVLTLVFCDGNVLNDDLGFFLEEERANKPRYRQGPFGEGVVHKTASYIFPNLLDSRLSELAGKMTLIHPEKDLQEKFSELTLVHVLKRFRSDGSVTDFYLYRYGEDRSVSAEVSEIELFREWREEQPVKKPARRFVVPD